MTNEELINIIENLRYKGECSPYAYDEEDYGQEWLMAHRHDAWNNALAAVQRRIENVIEQENSLYEEVLELVRNGYDVIFRHDEITDSFVMQIRKGEFADAYGISLSLITPYEVSKTLIEMEKSMEDAIENLD